MTIRLFDLAGVPPEEADAVRDLLHAHRIRFYETPRGNWGESLAAIWLPDASQLEYARRLISDYQQKHLKKARAAYASKARSNLQDRIKSQRVWYSFLLFVLLVTTSIVVSKMLGLLLD